MKRWLQTAKSGIIWDTKGKEVSKDTDNSTMSKRAQFSRKASDLIDKVVMSKEGSELLSRTLKSLNTKMNSLLLVNHGQKTKESEKGGKSSQTKVVKDPIQIKRKGA